VRVLSEGVYGLDYHAAIEKPDFIGSGLAMLRNGKILGTDRCGSVFIGSYDYDKASAKGRVSLRLQFGPGELVTGLALGEAGAVFEAVAGIEDGGKVETTVDVAGQPVIVRLTYIGPLPS
jgi:hypothetical protein